MEDRIQDNLFLYGSRRVRADFHLHTREDKEFIYAGPDSHYISEYVSGLKKAGIRVGVIANHNKFICAEYKVLRRNANKAGIYLLPGVELCVNDGQNGIHVLVVFSEQWLTAGQDYISAFIANLFPGCTESEYYNNNKRCSVNLTDLVGQLDRLSREYFLIFAHVEDENGLWRELGGGRLSDFRENQYNAVKKRTLGFQKVRTRDLRSKVKSWLGEWYPAEVEGSDCKSISQIGAGELTYIKIGAYTYDAVRFALLDEKNRTGREPDRYLHSHMTAARFSGGTLDGEELHFSPELNTLIGIRGSGKSSIIEAIRYALEIPFGEKSEDRSYKQDLVGFTLGSGGKIEIDAIDRYGQSVTIRRVWRENSADVLIDGKLQPGVSIRESIIRRPIYFGQKDLSKTGEGFERDLVDKLLGSNLDVIRQAIAQQKQKVVELIERYTKISSFQDLIDEQNRIINDTQHCLSVYKTLGVEQKLKKRLDFDQDLSVLDKGITIIYQYTADLENIIALYEEDMKSLAEYRSTHHEQLFAGFFAVFERYTALLDQIKNLIGLKTQNHEKLTSCQAEMHQNKKDMIEEFAAIERKLSEELKSEGKHSISSDEFIRLKKKLNDATQMLHELKRQGDQKKSIEEQLSIELVNLNALWLQEFEIIKRELDKIGKDQSPIQIKSGYKEDKTAFLSFMKDMFRGSGLREATYQGIVEQYTDFIDIYRDFNHAKTLFGSNPQTFTDWYMKNLKSLLTYQTPNLFTIFYRNKELRHHSLGQRASALILFVLSQKENDVIIIDQPEDDLDNQTIYEDVIKLVRAMKKQVQFIFATHNPNIPVLGDADQVFSCTFMDDSVDVCSGSIDNPEMQQRIVDIMEGGQEAFDRRKEIYQIWKP